MAAYIINASNLALRVQNTCCFLLCTSFIIYWLFVLLCSFFSYCLWFDTGGPVDPCANRPCRNGGRCTTLSETEYRCTCAVGYTGRDCERRKWSALYGLNPFTLKHIQFVVQICCCITGIMQVNPCDRRPCQNGGLCSPLSENEYACRCPAGFEGRDCERRECCGVMCFYICT